MPHGSSPPQPDDWQAHIAQGHQEQLASLAARIGNQGRRGNYMVGGCVMLLGLLVMMLGIGVGVTVVVNPKDWGQSRDFEGLVILLVGGAVTIGAG